MRFLKSAAEFSRSTCNSKIANLRIKQGERPDWSKILHRPQSFFNQFDLQSLALSIRVLPCYLHIYIGPTAGGQPSCFMITTNGIFDLCGCCLCACRLLLRSLLSLPGLTNGPQAAEGPCKDIIALEAHAKPHMSS